MSVESEIYYWQDKYLTLKDEYDKLQEMSIIDVEDLFYEKYGLL